MTYCTKTDITNERLNSEKLAELTYHAPQEDEDGDGVYPTLDARTEAAIADVGAMIDAYIGERYSLPVSDESALAFLKAIALDMAVYKLFQRYSMESEAHKEAYDEALKLLTEIRDGKLTLPGAAEASVDGISYSADDRTLTRDSMESM